MTYNAINCVVPGCESARVALLPSHPPHCIEDLSHRDPTETLSPEPRREDTGHPISGPCPLQSDQRDVVTPGDLEAYTIYEHRCLLANPIHQVFAPACLSTLCGYRANNDILLRQQG